MRIHHGARGAPRRAENGELRKVAHARAIFANYPERSQTNLTILHSSITLERLTHDIAYFVARSLSRLTFFSLSDPVTTHASVV